MTLTDWHAWHETYDDPESWQAQRLATVQGHIRDVLDAAPPGGISVLALVAGQGRDLLPVLATHPRRDDVCAILVELDPRNTAAAEDAVRAAGLSGVEVITGDAGLIDHYRAGAPADLVLICGLFPHITDADIEHVVKHSTSLTKRGGVVIWTRHRREPDMVPRISGWFREQGFEEVWVSEPQTQRAVGVHRYERDPRPVVFGTRLFTFVGVQKLRPWEFPETQSA